MGIRREGIAEGDKYLVVAREIRQLPGLVTQCSHDPVRISLPRGVQEPVAHIHDKIPRKVLIKHIHLPQLIGIRRITGALHFLFNLETTAPDDIDDDEEDGAAPDGAVAAGEAGGVEEEAE